MKTNSSGKTTTAVKRILTALLLFPSMLMAQHPFRINGKVDALKNGDKIYLVYQVEDKQITDSTLVQDGKFTFAGKIEYPVQASLFLNKNAYVNRPARGEVIDFLRFYLDPVTFSMTAADSLTHVVIKGSVTNKLNKELQAVTKRNDNSFDSLYKAFSALPEAQQKDSQVHAGFVAKEVILLEDFYRTRLNFIKQYPDAYFSVINLVYIAGEPALNAEARAFYDQLTPALKKTSLAKDVVTKLDAVKKTSIGEVAPDFEQSAPDGKKVKLSDFRSQYVLLDFWASWCGPCREESPNLVAAYKQYKDKGFKILGVSLDNPGQREAWLKAIEKDQLEWTQVADLKGWQNDAAKLYGIRSIPANFLLDPNGKIIARDLRGNALQAKLAEVFKDAAAGGQ